MRWLYLESEWAMAENTSQCREIVNCDKTLHLISKRREEILFCPCFQATHLDAIRHDTLSHSCSATIRLKSHSQMSLHDTDFSQVSVIAMTGETMLLILKEQ